VISRKVVLPPRHDYQSEGRRVVPDDVEEGTVHVQLAVVVNEARFAELIHEETDASGVVSIMSASVSWLIFGMIISGFPFFTRWAATHHMLLLNRPGNDSVGLQ
jgi:hypothetical protein